MRFPTGLSLRSRAVGSGLVALALGLAALPALAQTTPPSSNVTNSSGPCNLPNQAIQLDLQNPNAGDVLSPGTFQMAGYAYDKTATSGSGIDSVTVLLGPRESGGPALGNVVLGGTNPTVSAGSQFASAGFTISSARIPSVNSGPNAIYVYAHSSVSGREAVLMVPVEIQNGNVTGTATPTPVGGPMKTCTSPSTSGGGQAPASAGTPVPSTTGSGAPVPGVPAAPSAIVTNNTGPCTLANQEIQLDLANPSPGDALTPGTFQLSGYAYDKLATSGSGISSVVIMLGARESGGQPLGNVELGTANPTVAANSQFATSGFMIASATIPTVNAGPNTLYVYAASGVRTGEAVLQVPIQIAPQGGSSGTATPTPTGGATSTCSSPSITVATATPVPSAPAANSNPAIAADGQTLANQPADAQALFRATWGAQADVEWAREHNASIGAGNR